MKLTPASGALSGTCRIGLCYFLVKWCLSRHLARK